MSTKEAREALESEAFARAISAGYQVRYTRYLDGVASEGATVYIDDSNRCVFVAEKDRVDFEVFLGALAAYWAKKGDGCSVTHNAGECG